MHDMHGAELFSAFMHWLHISSAVVWLGGLSFHFLVLRPSLKDLDHHSAERLSSIAAMRFRALALSSLIVLLLSGMILISGIMHGISVSPDHASSGFLGSSYGRALGVKVILAVSALGVNAFSGMFLAPRLIGAMEARDAGRIKSIGKAIDVVNLLALILGVVILGLVGLMRVNA